MALKRQNKDYNFSKIEENLKEIASNNIIVSEVAFIENTKKLLTLYNENFLRIRYGDAYQILILDSFEKVEFYVRVASSCSKWFDLLWEFVYNNQKRIKDITIVRDDYAGCKPGYYYLNNKKVDHMDITDFITLSGNPELDTYIEEDYNSWFKWTTK